MSIDDVIGDDWPQPFTPMSLERATARAAEEARDTRMPRYVVEVVLPVGPKDAPRSHDVWFGVYSAADLEALRGRIAEGGGNAPGTFTPLRLVSPDGRIQAA